MAEFIFKKMLSERGLSGSFSVSSSATSTEEIIGGEGSPVYPPVRKLLTERKIPFDRNKRATLLLKSDYGKYDAFICMDSENMRNMLRIFGSDPEGKLYKLMDFAGGGDVADPWYSDRFDIAYGDICRGLSGLLSALESDSGINNDSQAATGL